MLNTPYSSPPASQQNVVDAAMVAQKEEITSPNLSCSTVDDKLEDNERINLIVREPSPTQQSHDDESISAKKRGKRPMCGKN